MKKIYVFLSSCLLVLLAGLCSCSTTDGIDIDVQNRKLITDFYGNVKEATNNFATQAETRVETEEDDAALLESAQECATQIVNGMQTTFASYSITDFDRQYYTQQVDSNFFKNATEDELMTYFRNNATPKFYNLLEQLRVPGYNLSLSQTNIIDDTGFTINEKVILLIIKATEEQLSLTDVATDSTTVPVGMDPTIEKNLSKVVCSRSRPTLSSCLDDYQHARQIIMWEYIGGGVVSLVKAYFGLYISATYDIIRDTVDMYRGLATAARNLRNCKSRC